MSRPHDPAFPEPETAGEARRISGCRVSAGGASAGMHLSAAAGFLVCTASG
ncbi:MAG: hypothetical protein M3Y33_10680 [Actinomycetota bacterium]|nr:hypothetical protein [Actinomycetota bacterium]